jgi:hypothetical protein
LKAELKKLQGLPEQNEQCGDAEAVVNVGIALETLADDDYRGHQRSPYDRRLGAGQKHIKDDPEQQENGMLSPWHMQKREHNKKDECNEADIRS